jgi:hypothetical protein
LTSHTKILSIVFISLLAGCGNYTPTAGVTPATDYRETLRQCSREMHAAYGYDWLYGFGLVGATVAMASNSQPGGRDDYYRDCMARHGYTDQGS